MAEDHEYDLFVQLHSAQLKTTGIPDRYWRSLHRKLKNEIYDAGSYFTMNQDKDDDTWHVQVCSEDGLKMEDPEGIFLVDHAWTYQLEFARKQLEMTMNLAERMSMLMDCLKDYDIEEISNQGFLRSKLIDLVLEKMWRFNQTYQVGVLLLQNNEVMTLQGDEGSRETVWFVMDEFGSRFAHSDDCNFAFKVFFYIPTKVTYTVIYPIKDVECGAEATRDYIPEVEGSEKRKARLYPWYPHLLDLDSVEDHWMEERMKVEKKDRCGEAVPKRVEYANVAKKTFFKIYSESPETDFLTSPHFTVVDNKEEADILWLTTHFKDFESLSQTPEKFVNQFPREYNLTCKDLLAETGQRWLALMEEKPGPELMEHRGPLWLPTTFNLHSELPQFIKHFKEREKKGLDNIWMCKPWNLSRGLGHVISSNLNEIIRQAETGPRVACKYIDDPVLFQRPDGKGLVKFDFRYMFLLKCLEPLDLYAHAMFFPRFANREFSKDRFDEYERHFTTMNYRQADRYLLHWNEFRNYFNEQYPELPWDLIEEQAFQVARELFQCTARSPEPLGIEPNPQSRALYGIDFMVQWANREHTSMQVMVCEVNFCCDNKRMCTTSETAMNEVFETLFLDKSVDNVIKL